MDGFGKMLRKRAVALGLTDSEVARRLGLSQARYHNYVSDTAEPDLATLLRICRTLSTSPNEALAFDGATSSATGDDLHRDRVTSAISGMEGDALAYMADLVEALVAVQRRRMATPTRRRPSAHKQGNRSWSEPKDDDGKNVKD